MEIINRVSRMSSISAKTLITDVKVGLVPTSRAITPGHLSLVRTARNMADLVVVSIFVNRFEFSSEEECARYPRDLTADIDVLTRENVDYVFIPPEDEIFPPGFSTFVEVQASVESAGLPAILLKGFATGAVKMLHLAKPAFVFYGEQEAVQGAILRKMIRDLNISTEVVIAPAGRAASGLAYSGCNRLLTESESTAALVLCRSLNAAENAIASGETRPKKVLAEMARVMETEPLVKLEYAVVIDPGLVKPVSRIQGAVTVGVGGKIGNVFLSDAVVIGKPSE